MTMGLAVRVPSLGSALGRPASSFKVAVIDRNGRPVKGAAVEVILLSGEKVRAMTDSDGIAIVQFDREIAPNAPVTVTVWYGVYALRQEHRASEGDLGVFMVLPVCVAQPFITTAEAIAFGLGVIIAVAGSAWKKEVAKISGEILAGAAVFTLVYRHSCIRS